MIIGSWLYTYSTRTLDPYMVVVLYAGRLELYTNGDVA